jgi:hypothetical protein
MAIQAMWVHGNSAVIELTDRGRGSGEDIGGLPWTALQGFRSGPGVEYRCQDNSQYWFHFAIPTPVIDDGVPARLRRVTVLFTAGRSVTLTSVHVWDGPGPSPIFTMDGLGIGGANLELIDGRNSFALPNKAVHWGIGVSVRFNFADSDNVILHSAGVDFES